MALPFRTGMVDELRLAGLPLTIVDDAALREVNRVMKRTGDHDIELGWGVYKKMWDV